MIILSYNDKAFAYQAVNTKPETKQSLKFPEQSLLPNHDILCFFFFWYLFSTKSVSLLHQFTEKKPDDVPLWPDSFCSMFSKG